MAALNPNAPAKAELKRRHLDAWPSMIQRLGDPFRPLDPECEIVQFGRALSDDELQRAGAIMAERPDVVLRVFMPKSADLTFLRHFPTLRKLELDIWELDSLEGLSYVRDTLEAFRFGKTRKRFSLGFLATLPRLQDLYLEGHTKDIDVLGGLVDVTVLALRGITLPDLTLLLKLTGLRDLSIRLGGTRDLRFLPRFTKLERLDLMRITQLDDLSMLPELEQLELLTLDWMRNVTHLPSLAPLKRLATVYLDAMKELTSLEPIAAAPALRYLQVVSMPQLKARHFACFGGHPSLAVLDAFPGGKKVHDEIKLMFPGVAR